MISLPELLRRFRRAWAPPGPALTRVAPPVDVAARLRTELRPVLDAIAEIQTRATAVRSEADAQAAALLDTAGRDADQKVREAEQQGPSARTAAAKQKHRAADEEITAVLAAGRTEAQRIAEQSQKQLPELIAAVRDCVLKGPQAAS